ncbi:LysR family transcriptional regulator [Fulvimarina sp. MAC8]|uniref:winged helix-turn-helix domain-containing protein n=1 Tax=Fulvimarina sp. MAC8 TaxID=3162874 RepID=UPI0032EBD905
MSRKGLTLLRVSLGPVSIGPGKANLLAAIEETGSISAAARRLRMSYKRAWSLTEDMNSAFAEPVVTAARGGTSGGGAQLTETGRQLFEAYRRMECAASNAIGADVEMLTGLLRGAPPANTARKTPAYHSEDD